MAAADHIGTARLDGRMQRAASFGAVLAAACLTAVCLVAAAGPARAGSAAQPGQSLGLPSARRSRTACTGSRRRISASAPRPPGDAAQRQRHDPGLGDAVGHRRRPLQLFLAGSYSAVRPQDGDWQSGLGQPLVAAQLAWDLGGDVGFSYLLGGYFPGRTGIVTQAPSLTHRFALSYVGNDWNLTGHLFYGHFLGDRPPPGVATYPDSMNLDLTATRNVGKWQIGAVAFGSTDLPTGVAGYRAQGQVAVGGLVGYNFGPVNLQAYVTRDVIDRNYGGRDTRAWLRAVVPLYQDKREAAPDRTLLTREQTR